MPIVLSQNAIRIALLPINIIVLIICITISAYLTNQIPEYEFSSFVFWLLKPTLKIQTMMTAIILVIGLAGNISYNKCWQASFAFFIFVLTVVYGVGYYFSKNLIDSAENVIPRLYSIGGYRTELLGAFQEIKCLRWEPTKCVCSNDTSLSECSGEEYNQSFAEVYKKPCQELNDTPNYEYNDIGAKDYIMNKIETLPPLFEKLELTGTIIMVIYDVYSILFFLFIAETTQYQNEDKNM